MIIYLVSGWTDYEGHDAASGAFYTLEKAQEYANTLSRDGFTIIETEIDNPDICKEVG